MMPTVIPFIRQVGSRLAPAVIAPPGAPPTVDAATLIPVAAGAAGVTAMILAAAVAHGVLQPLLEARGVRPWTVRDTVGSTMLVLIGSGLAAASVVALTIGRTAAGNLGWLDVLCLALLAAGALMLRLGLLALRKLT